MFTIEAVSGCTAELKFYDWNRFASNELLGIAKVTLDEFKFNVLQDLWVSLSTQGSVHILVQVSPFQIPPVFKDHANERLPQLRMQLESVAYYPGSTVRGAVVYGLLKPKKLHAIRIIIDGRQFTQWSTGSKNKTHYYGTCVFFNSTATLVGSSNKKESLVQPTGENIFPFEYILPMQIPPSYNSTAWSGCIRYTATAFVDIAGKPNKVNIQHLTVLSHPSSIRSVDNLVFTTKLDTALLSKKAVQLAIEGASVAYTG